MPGPWQAAEKDEPWYAFTSGPVHWVVLCIEKVRREGGSVGRREGLCNN
jgi:hypothetical protein